MTVYISLIIFTLCCAFYVHYVTTEANTLKKYEFNNRNFLGLFIFLTVILILTVGLRADSVGLDTLTYKQTYLKYKNYDYSFLKTKKLTEEIGFIWLMITCNKLNLSWQAFATLMATMYIVPIMVLSYKKSENVFWSASVFLIGGSWVFSLSTMRQAFAIGLTVIAFMFEEKKKNILCILFILLASLFHLSAIATLIYFVILKIKLTKNNAPLWAIIGILSATVCLTFLRNVMHILMEYVDRGYRETEAGGLLTEVFYVLNLIISYFLTDIFEEGNEKYLRYVKAVFLTAVLLPILRINPAAFRGYFYFSIYGAIFIPILISRIRDVSTKLMAFICYGITYIYMFMTSINNARVTEFLFFWDR